MNKIGKAGKTAIAGILLTSLLAFGTAQADDYPAPGDPSYVVVCASPTGLNTIVEASSGILDFADEQKSTPKGPRDRQGLLEKLADADAKVGQDKLCDASQKVSDFNSKLSALVTGGKGNKQKVFENHAGALECALQGSAALAAEYKSGLDCPDKGGK